MKDVWIRLPDPDDGAATGWPPLMAALAAPAHRGALTVSLTQALVHAVLHPAPAGIRRVRAVLLDDPPVDVRAWAFADLVPRAVDPGDAAGRFVAALEVPDAQEPARPWSRSVERIVVDDDPAVVVHDLLAAAGTGELEHRVVVARFPATPATLRVTVTTTRIGAVPDLVGTALDLARRLEAAPVPEGTA